MPTEGRFVEEDEHSDGPSTRLMRLGLQASRCFAFEWDVGTDVMRFAASEGILGMDEGADLRTSEAFDDRIHPDDRLRRLMAVRDLSPTRTGYHVRYRFVRPDGTVLVLGEATRGVFDEAGRLQRAAGTMIDLTEHFDRVPTPAELDPRLYVATAATRGIMYDWDLVTGRIWRSPNLYDLLGFRPEETPQIEPPGNADGWWTSRIHPEDRRRIKSMKISFVGSAKNPVVNTEYRIRHRDGHYLWVWDHSQLVDDRSGNPSRMVGYVISIEARKRAEAEILRLQEHSAQFHAILEVLVENAPIGVAFVDREFRYIIVNDNLACLNGLPPEQHVGRRVEEIIPEYWVFAEKHFRQARDGEAVKNVEFTLEHHSRPGERTTFLVNYYPVRLSGEEVVGIGVLLSDVTTQKRAEEALRDGHRRKDEFLAMLAHELRNPLAPIKGAAEILRTSGPTAQRRLYEIIDRQVDQLSRLVDDLLDVARVSRGWLSLRKEPLDVAAIVNRAVEACRPFIDTQGHTLVVSPPETPAFVDGDAARLTQVVSNLLNNAAKYTNPGGRITVEIDTKAQRKVVIRVRDTGRGIGAADLPHVFDLFYQADRELDRAEGGLGIGLSLVRTLVEMHGGNVVAESEGLGRGSTFVVELPRIEAEPERFTPKAPAKPARPLRVLVVDDNVDAAETMAMLIEGLGHEVSVAHDGASALRMASRDAPDVVLLDIGLPHMDGYEVCKRLRSAGLDKTRLVALTGYGHADDRRRALEVGFDAHLVKPASLEMIEAILGKP